MKTIVCFMFLLLIWTEECCTVNISQVKARLNTAFEIDDRNDVFIITITRTPIDITRPTALISHDEFEQILKLLYGLCANQDAPMYQQTTQLSNDPNCSAISFSRNCINNVDMLSNQLKIFFTSNRMQNSCKIIVFNEMFFSQERPLTSEQKDFILDNMLSLSRNATNAIFYVNFLYTEDRDIGVYQGLDRYRRMKELKDQGRMAIADEAFDYFTKNILNKSFGPYNRSYQHLINETYAINNHNILTKYKKSSYFHECDEEVSSGTIYDAGFGRDEMVSDSLLANTLLDSISTEICFDLACGIRLMNGWSNNLGRPQSILHLIQSNWIDPLGTIAPNDNINRLPQNVCIVHSDSNISDLRRKLFYIEGLNAINVLSDNVLYSIEIGDSIYTISISMI